VAEWRLGSFSTSETPRAQVEMHAFVVSAVGDRPAPPGVWSALFRRGRNRRRGGDLLSHKRETDPRRAGTSCHAGSALKWSRRDGTLTIEIRGAYPPTRVPPTSVLPVSGDPAQQSGRDTWDTLRKHRIECKAEKGWPAGRDTLFLKVVDPAPQPRAGRDTNRGESKVWGRKSKVTLAGGTNEVGTRPRSQVRSSLNNSNESGRSL